MSVSRTEALRVFNKRYRAPELAIYAVGDTDVKGPERDLVFGWTYPFLFTRRSDYSAESACLCLESRWTNSL